MCGFAFTTDPATPIEELSNHRGPDLRTLTPFGPGRVLFDRLSIVGGASGQQPLSSQSGRWVVVFNGEIYNFRKLQRTFSLEQSKSDTRTLVAGLEKLGLDFLHQLRGMYSGLVYDSLERRLFSIRDPLGEKPAYYAIRGPHIYLASEFSAVAQMLGGGLELSATGLRSFFTFGYVEEPDSLDSRISAVPRGSISELAGPPWRVLRVASLEGYSASDTEQSLTDLLIDIADESATTADVPQAISLSGGFDSGLIATIQMLRGNPESVTPISAHFGWTRAALIEALSARRVGRSFQNRIRLPYERNRANLFRNAISRMDQPIADAASMGLVRVFEAARANERLVVWNGQGGDEFFFGYPEQMTYLSNIDGGGNRDHDAELFIPRSAGLFGDDWVTHLARRNFGSSDENLVSTNPFRRTRAFLVHSYLSHNGLAQADRLAMSFGVEPRSPLADSRLYAWSQSNETANSTHGLNKLPLKSAIELRQHAFLVKQKKRGFVQGLGIGPNRPDRVNRVSQAASALIDFGIFKPPSQILRTLCKTEPLRIIALVEYLTTKRVQSASSIDESV